MNLKKICALLPALLLLTACGPVGLRAESPAVPASGVEKSMSEAEIQEKLSAVIAGVPKAETTEITLTALPMDDETGGGVTLYSASVGMTWDAQLGRFSTEKALDGYSRALALAVMSDAPPVVLLDIAWTIPYHAADEVAMRYSFGRSENVLWETGLYDRFTDGSFGADAFLETPVNPVPASVKIDAAPIAALSGSLPVSFWAPLPPTAEQAEIVKATQQTVPAGAAGRT